MNLYYHFAIPSTNSPEPESRLAPHMDVPDLQTRLSQHRTLGGAPAGELAWLAAHGYLRHFDRGEVVARKGGQALEGITVANADSATTRDVEADAMFIFFGSAPRTGIVQTV